MDVVVVGLCVKKKDTSLKRNGQKMLQTDRHTKKHYDLFTFPTTNVMIPVRTADSFGWSVGMVYHPF
jgi:hypothetical protein